MTSDKEKSLQVTKDQHIVPKCYLKQWCNDQGRLYAYKLQEGYISTASPKSAATRTHIYDTVETLNQEDPDNFQIFERTLGLIENEFPKVFDEVFPNARRLHSPILIPTEYTRVSETITDKIIRLAVVQFLRDTRHRESVRFRMNSWMKQIWDITVPMMFESEHKPDVHFESINEDYLTEWVVEYLKDSLQKFSVALKSKTMVIGLNKTSKPLLTSDSPVHWSGYYIDASANWDGINSRTFQMVYPLAPDVCVIFYDPNYYQEQLQYHKCVRTLSQQEVQDFNQALALHSDKQMFSNSSDFSHVEFALAQQKIAGDKWPLMRSTPVSDSFLELCLQLSITKNYTKEEWKTTLQFDSATSVDNYRHIQQQLLATFQGPLA
jgi:hypothetical protein